MIRDNLSLAADEGIVPPVTDISIYNTNGVNNDSDDEVNKSDVESKEESAEESEEDSEEESEDDTLIIIKNLIQSLELKELIHCSV